MGRRFAGWALPLGWRAGGGKSIPEVDVLVVCRREREAVVVLKAGGRRGVVGRKVMKKGVTSPAKGIVLLSVVLPRKVCSAKLGAAGEGVKRSLVKGSDAVPVLVELERIWVSLAGTVPLRKRISNRKLG